MQVNLVIEVDFLDFSKTVYMFSHSIFLGKNVQNTTIQACNTLSGQLADGLGSVLHRAGSQSPVGHHRLNCL